MRAPSALIARVERVAHGDPAREAAVSGAVRVTYRELAEAVAGAADALVRAGLRPGARVAHLGVPNPLFLVSTLAVQKAGGVWTGINPRYTIDEIVYGLADCRPSLVVADAATGEHAVARLAEAVARLDPPPPMLVATTVADLERPPHRLSAPEAPLTPEVALVVYTSGTTGRPKGACLTHAGIAEACCLYAKRYAHPGLRSLLNLPINHVGALIDLAASALWQGGTLVCMSEFDPAAIPDVLREERVTLLGQVPAMHLAIEAATGYEPTAIPTLRHLVWSGAAMPRSWIERHHGRGVELSTCYGQTEITGSVTFTLPDADVDALADGIGVPAAQDLIRIIGPNGVTVLVGEPGELCVAGPSVMHGYLGRPDATTEAFTADGWLRSGDLATWREDGSVALVGRLKEMFKSGGYNVYPREVETVLEGHPAVHAAAVVTMPDPKWQEVGWAFVIADPSVDPEAVLGFARERLANFKVPKRVVVSSDLPLLPIGKIDKRLLKEWADAGEYD